MPNPHATGPGASSAPPASQEHPMRAVLTFESMITPKIITFLYWLLLLAVAIGGIGTMLSFGRLSFTSFASGLLIIAGGALAARIWCELLIVLFKINEHMQTVSNRL